MPVMRLAQTCLLGLLLGSLACTTKTEPGSLVVGIMSEDLQGAVSNVRVTVRVESADAGSVSLPVTALPYEWKLGEPPSSPTALVDVSVEGYASGSEEIVLRRL